MAITCKIGNQFNEEYSKGEHDLRNDSLIAILMDTTWGPFVPATHLTYTEVGGDANNEIATGYGYTQKTLELTTVSLDQVAGVMTLNADNLTWTASGDAIETCRACIIINETHVNDTVICCIEFGANYVTVDGSSLTINLINGLIKLTANPA